MGSAAPHRVRHMTAALRATVPLPEIQDLSRKSSSERRFSHEPQIIGLVRLPVHIERSLAPLPVLAENPVRPKIGLDWACTTLPSWIVTVYLRINWQPS